MRKTEGHYTCNIDIFMALAPDPAGRADADTQVRATLDFVYRADAWHVEDRDKDWVGKVIVEKIFQGAGIPVDAQGDPDAGRH